MRTSKIRRHATQILHWVIVILLVFLLSVDQRIYGGLGWAFVVSGGTLCLLGLLFGLMNKYPSPALEGAMRWVHPWLSRAMYLLLGWVVLALAGAAAGYPLSGPEARNLLLVLAAAACGHAILHLWRHTGLRDGALRRIVPHVFHKFL